jgi:hypothetical protein
MTVCVDLTLMMMAMTSGDDEEFWTEEHVLKSYVWVSMDVQRVHVDCGIV